MDGESRNGTVRFYENLKPSVFVLKLIPGMEPEILQYIGERYDAIIIESYGVGGIPFYNKRNFLSGLENLTKKRENCGDCHPGHAGGKRRRGLRGGL